jgi:oligopeptide transport system permease protein
MLSYALRRLASLAPILLVVVTLAFALVRSVPGGPFDGERSLPPEVEANLLAAYDLDRPLHVQFGRYLWRLLHGDLGPSFRYRDKSVSELIGESFPVSARIGGAAITVALTLGLALGTFAALRRDTPLDAVVMGVAMTGIAVPVFVTAPLLALLFGVYLKLLPVAGWSDGALPNLVLPVTALALPYVAIIARLARASMVEVMQSNHIRTARAKGLAPMRVVLVHAMPAAITPVVSFLGPALAGVLTGSVVVEQIFGLPGLGRHFINGALNRDYTLVMGIVIFYAALIVALNLIVDLVQAALDPRVRLS